MKDRIRQIMESQHMTQQVFAQFIEMSPATLSSIFTGRTNPTMNIVGAIKKKIPNISTDWLMFGIGPMYLDDQSVPSRDSTPTPQQGILEMEPAIDFDLSPAPTPKSVTPQVQDYNGVKGTRSEKVYTEVKFADKSPRKVIEIRVFYDDQTWDTFVPEKK